MDSGPQFFKLQLQEWLWRAFA